MYNRCEFFNTVWGWVLLLLLVRLSYTQEIFTARIVSSNPGTQFIPVIMPAQLISTMLTDSFKKCSILCTSNILCRVFDYQASVPKQCRLFEGDTNTLGQIASSSFPQSNVGIVQFSPALFAEYGSACSFSCPHSRYLQCSINFTCECMPHTYWNASVSMCVPQSPILGAPCQQNMSMCREDINYTCLQFNQCGPLSVLSGTTIIGTTTVIPGSSTPGLNSPYGITVFGPDTDSIVIVDLWNARLIAIWDASTIYQNISVVATEWAPGQPLCLPFDLFVDRKNSYNLYLSDYCSAQVILYSNMQSISPTPLVVVNTAYIEGATANHINAPFGIYVDSHYNVYVVSQADNIVVFWPLNATYTNATVVVGLDRPDNTSMGLDQPYTLELDENNSWLYVADANNNRIQRYSVNGTWPCIGTTVAGGNGIGAGAHQLYYPTYIRISEKTGTMYIVDSNNNRIQRWEQGATTGVTIAGDPYGNSGSSATMLYYPTGLTINDNETLMYVTDSSNNRVQRFQLI